ncbi:leucine-rich repeat-containing 2 [Labeo rohita]|uniref:Leucine-rich repeat-containing 2 n=1 Tax=Labeo rohita TaxID=84645 RepID=A0A498L7J9_LABRO|nr:leucine-rich repeat-containing 2 [Labeo rohita]
MVTEMSYNPVRCLEVGVAKLKFFPSIKYWDENRNLKAKWNFKHSIELHQPSQMINLARVHDKYGVKKFWEEKIESHIERTGNEDSRMKSSALSKCVFFDNCCRRITHNPTCLVTTEVFRVVCILSLIHICTIAEDPKGPPLSAAETSVKAGDTSASIEICDVGEPSMAAVRTGEAGGFRVRLGRPHSVVAGVNNCPPTGDKSLLLASSATVNPAGKGGSRTIAEDPKGPPLSAAETSVKAGDTSASIEICDVGEPSMAAVRTGEAGNPTAADETTDRNPSITPEEAEE